jgi:DNA mismatch repair protein MutL
VNPSGLLQSQQNFATDSETAPASANNVFANASDAPWDIDSRREERGAVAPFKPFSDSNVFAPATNRFAGTQGGAFQLTEEVSRDYAGALDPNQATLVREQMVAWAKGELAQQTSALAGGIDGAPSESIDAPLGKIPAYPEFLTPNEDVPAYGHAPLELLPFQRPDGERASQPAQYPSGDYSQSYAAREQATQSPNSSVRSSAIQIHNKYLVAETSDGLVVIDQHALHERIIYEQLRTKVLAGAVESQALLVPEPVDFNPADAGAILAQKETLEKIGIGIEPFGGGTILVNSYPAILANFRPADILKDVVDQLIAEGKTPQRRDILDELLHMISCKAAIKAGDRLSQAEVLALVEQRNAFQDSHHCPHGRPTMLNFSREELDKQFKRI